MKIITKQQPNLKEILEQENPPDKIRTLTTIKLLGTDYEYYYELIKFNGHKKYVRGLLPYEVLEEIARGKYE